MTLEKWETFLILEGNEVSGKAIQIYPCCTLSAAAESYSGNAFDAANLLRGIHRAWKKNGSNFCGCLCLYLSVK